jgi:MerR, DNA binding
VHTLLDLADQPDRDCAAVDEVARTHLAEVDRKLADLGGLRHALADLIDRCGHLPVSFRHGDTAMKYPDLIPIYAHVLCNEELSEVTEDIAQHLFQRAVDAGLLQPDEGHEGHGLCSGPTMIRLLEVTGAAPNVELRRLANRLDARLLREFPTKLMRQ